MSLDCEFYPTAKLQTRFPREVTIVNYYGFVIYQQKQINIHKQLSEITKSITELLAEHSETKIIGKAFKGILKVLVFTKLILLKRQLILVKFLEI